MAQMKGYIMLMKNWILFWGNIHLRIKISKHAVCEGQAFEISQPRDATYLLHSVSSKFLCRANNMFLRQNQSSKVIVVGKGQNGFFDNHKVNWQTVDYRL